MGNNCRAYRRSFVEACLASAPSKAAGWLDTLEEVLRSVVVRHAIEVDRQCSYPYQSVHALRQIGLFGVNVPVEAGGLGFGDSVATLAVESIASACASTAAIVLFHLQVSRRLVQFGNAIQIDEDLPLLASGQWLASSAWTEAGSGADKAQSGTIVDGSEHGRRITGEKTFCTGLEGASLIHVLAGVRRADGTVAPTFIRVRTDVPGVDTGDIYDLVGLRGSSTGTIRLKGVEVDDNDIVGGIGDGMKLMQANHTVLLNPGLLGLGVARTAYEETKRLSRGLSAAMRDITGYQHTRFVLADMELALGSAYAYAAAASRHVCAGLPLAHLECMKAKCHAAKMAVELTSASVQLTGSRAYTHSLPLDRYYRDARATMAMGPTTEIIKERIASQLLNETPWEDMP